MLYGLLYRSLLWFLLNRLLWYLLYYLLWWLWWSLFNRIWLSICNLLLGLLYTISVVATSTIWYSNFLYRLPIRVRPYFLRLNLSGLSRWRHLYALSHQILLSSVHVIMYITPTIMIFTHSSFNLFEMLLNSFVRILSGRLFRTFWSKFCLLFYHSRSAFISSFCGSFFWKAFVIREIISLILQFGCICIVLSLNFNDCSRIFLDFLFHSKFRVLSIQRLRYNMAFKLNHRKYNLVQCLLTKQVIDIHAIMLPNSMGSIFCLKHGGRSPMNFCKNYISNWLS